MKFALVGNPNSGKTTLFNSLTGMNQYVGNWPGVTVEKKQGKIKKHKHVEVVDLPGIYSLSPYTQEEVVSRKFLLEEKPDLIINIIDTTNLERNLYLTSQLLELGIPCVIALNMIDIVRNNKDDINVEKLSKILGCPIVEISALKNDNIDHLVYICIEHAKCKTQPNSFKFDEKIESLILEIRSKFNVHKEFSRFNTIKIIEKDQLTLKQFNINLEKINEILSKIEKEYDTDSISIIVNNRYDYISEIISQCFKKGSIGLSITDKIDKIVTNKYLGLPIFFGIMFLIYFISVSTLGAYLTDFTNDILFGELISPNVESFLNFINCNEIVKSLVVSGIIGGVGAVLGFVPQLMLLFIFLAILEDCGYMSRIAFVLDKIFRKFGLSGKSFIPMLISSGCGVPGIMASRTIESKEEREITIMTTTFIPCGAKLPVIALISAALLGGSFFAAPIIYFLGIAMVIIVGVILRKTKKYSSDPSPFILELPPYHRPLTSGVIKTMWNRTKGFIIKAGTIIFVSSAIIWFLSSFNINMQLVDSGDSMLAAVGNFISPIFAPLGFGNWQSTVATLTGLVAKENLVNTFGVLLVGVDGLDHTSELLSDGLKALLNGSAIAAYSLLIFNMLCTPCIAAIGAMRKELGSTKKTIIACVLQTVVAYIVCLIAYNVVGLAFGVSFNFFSVVGIILLLVIGFLLFYRRKHAIH